MIIESARLRLVLQTPEEVRAWLEKLDASQQAELDIAWLEAVRKAIGPDPWLHGFVFYREPDKAEVGRGGFKGPPNSEGVVELAYGIEPTHEGKGYATEAAAALAAFAFRESSVRVVRAHTLPMPGASVRVLTKCGFQNIGEVVEPHDGRVWRWELYPAPLPAGAQAPVQH